MILSPLPQNVFQIYTSTTMLVRRLIRLMQIFHRNDFKAEFSRLRDEGSDSRKICSEFQAFFHIECSPQSDRKSAEKLDYKFINENTGEEIVVRCELHSKLKWDGMDRENQDRIYFHPGRPEIESGIVLIVHIGTHH